jgi:hypothetical protein
MPELEPTTSKVDNIPTAESGFPPGPTTRKRVVWFLLQLCGVPFVAAAVSLATMGEALPDARFRGPKLEHTVYSITITGYVFARCLVVYNPTETRQPEWVKWFG